MRKQLNLFTQVEITAQTSAPFIVITANDWHTHQAQLQRLENSLKKVYSEANEKEYFTPEETAKLLKISVKTLSNWRERNLISFFQVGSNIRFTKAQIEEFTSRNSLKAQ